MAAKRRGINIVKEIETAEDIVILPQGASGFIFAGIGTELSHDNLRFAHFQGGSAETVHSLVYSADEKPKISRIRCWRGLRVVKCRLVCCGPSLMVRVMSRNASSRRSAVGRAVSRLGLPA